MKVYLSQKQRLYWVLFYTLMFVLLNKFLFGSFAPSLSVRGFWFYAGISSLILGRLISTPFFTPPGDVIAYSIAALLGIVSTNSWSNWASWEQFIFSVCCVYFGVMCLMSIIAILCRGSSRQWIHQSSEALKYLVTNYGSCSAVFGVLMLYSLVMFHRESTTQILWIGSMWIVIGILSQEQLLHGVVRKVRAVYHSRSLPDMVGEIHAFQTPNVVLVSQRDQQPVVKAGTILALGGLNSLAVSLGYVGRDESRYLRALDLEKACNDSVPDKLVMISADEVTLNQFKDLIGIVSEQSDINLIHFEVIKDCAIKEGGLVEVEINDAAVLYQVVNGITAEEVISQKNTLGYIRAQAKKIGTWNAEEQKIELTPWDPKINTPVYLKKTAEEEDLPSTAIGRFPQTNFPVNIKSIHDMVTHNTAILGILGVGKTKLTMELVERILTEKIHVISIDLTDEHAFELGEFGVNAPNTQREIDELVCIADAGSKNVKQNKHEGGSVNEFKAKLKYFLKQFINSENEYLRIINPALFSVWRQIANPYQKEASMEILSPTGVTQIISECVLELLQSEGRSNGEAKVCLVYEEAHSLVPEWGSAVMEGDKTATNGTARAILQRRKYGLGCLLITQRTANVTKTILNQCNTIFAMRTFDDTGKDFLANYLGRQYANLLSDLPERHAVFFGRASACENPVLIRLNDQNDFRRVFRLENPKTENTQVDESLNS